VLLASRSLSQAKELLGLHWDSLQTIINRAVERGLERRELEHLRYLGLDEKSFGKGQSYISLLTDLEGSRVLEVMEGRDQQAAEFLFATLEEKQLAQVEAVAMDMAGFYAAAAQEAVPQAAIVHDKFHISMLLNKAVDQVRRHEHRELQKEQDDTLKGTRQTWLYNPINLSDQRLEDFQELLQLNLKTSRAWFHKENFAGFWEQEGAWAAAGYFKRWYASAIRSRLAPIKKVARTLKAHLARLLNYFSYPITNAVTEGLNSKIQQLKANARGFRSFANYRTRILFFCGKLELLPIIPGVQFAQ